MANEPQYRDLSKANPFLAPFNEIIVGRIDRVSMASAALVGLFGILYFSLAPAAMSTAIEVSAEKLSGYDCKMISAISKLVNPFSGFFGDGTGIISIQSQSEFVTKMVEASKSVPFEAVHSQSSNSQDFFVRNNYLQGQILLYDSAQFDRYENCLARAQITCNWLESAQVNSDRALSKFSCSFPDFKSTLQLKPLNTGAQFSTMTIGYAVSALSNQTLGKCNQQANLLTLSNVHEHCESLKIFMATFQDLIGKLVWTPEVICKPFFNNPPYICSKAVPPSVPSILSQSLAFTTSALAAVKAILFFSVKMFRKAPVADNSGIELDHSVSNVAKPEETP